MSGKTLVVNHAKYEELIAIFPASTDATVADGLTAGQITYIATQIALELQEQSALPHIKNFLTRIMAEA
jgi:hypothetical protein